MTRQAVDGELQGRLDELIADGVQARNADDLPGALSKWQEAWSLLPEPKLSWELYPQALTLSITDTSVDAGEIADAARWLELLEQAYTPHTEESRVLVDFVKAKLFFRAGKDDLAFAYFDAIVKAKGTQIFDGEAPAYLEFYRSHAQPETAPVSPAGAPRIEVPGPGTGRPQMQLDDATHRRVVQLIESGDELVERDDEAQAAQQYLEGLRLLPDPKTQWEHALMLYIALADVCLSFEQYEAAEDAARYAMQSQGGLGNGYVWLRLGDALRGQHRDKDALEAYTSAYMAEGDELFDGEDEALAMLDEAGIRKA